MNLVKKISFLIFFCMLSNSSFSQSKNLKNDEDYFKNQEKVYQKWLNHTGLGKILSVNTTIVKEDKLILYLQFPFSDTDSVSNAWERIVLQIDLPHAIEAIDGIYPTL